MPVERWSITHSAAELHRSILRPAGFARRGATCVKQDFLVREVRFHATRFVPPEDRSLQVSFGLSWRGAPNGQLGGRALREFVQPLVGEDELDPELVALVGGPVLDHLLVGATPEELLATLLTPGSLERPGLESTYSDLQQLWCAAWGAVVLGDEATCRQALGRARAEARTEDGDGDGRFTRWFEDDLRVLVADWENRYGRPLTL